MKMKMAKMQLKAMELARRYFITRAGDSMESWLRWACALSHCYYA